MSYERCTGQLSDGSVGVINTPKGAMVRRLQAEGLRWIEAHAQATRVIREMPDVCHLCGSRLDSMEECPIHG